MQIMRQSTLNCIFFLTLSFIAFESSAQEYKHGFGAQMNLFSFQETYTDATGLHNPVGAVAIPGLLYKASIGFDINKTRTLRLSAVTYAFLGFNINTATGGDLGVEVPLLAEFFLGDIDYFGGFLGVGGSFSYTAVSGFGNGIVIGPQIEGGLQFPIFERVVAVKLAYTYGLNKPSTGLYTNRVYTKDQRSLFSIGMMYIFGY
jgi:hypothetical protein